MLHFLFLAVKILIEILVQQVLQFNRPALYQEFERSMHQSLTQPQVDWSPIRQRMQLQSGQQLPVYPGNLKTDLIRCAGLRLHSKAETAFQLAQEIARNTTDCDPEIAYWFSRLVSLIDR